MQRNGTCTCCGTALTRDAPDRFCPVCTFRGALRLSEIRPARLGLHSPENRLGDYELLEEVARGGMGVVYRGRQISLNRIVAVKLILVGQFGNEAAVRRFKAEAAAAAKLRHPDIVAIYEIGEDAGHHFFSMEYVEGHNLADFMRQNPVSFRQAAQWVRRLAEAVHYAHEYGIVHRDLKPSNILIDDESEPHITDFGLAKDMAVDSDLTLTGQVIGSPNYISPEQASGRPVGTGSDIYSLGAILYHLLSGRPPFAAGTLTDTLRQVATRDPVPPRMLDPGIPRDLQTVCLKCLEKEPVRRYSTASALGQELGRFLNNEPIRARPLSPPARLWRWCGRKPALAAALALGVILAVGSPIAAVHIAHERNLAQRSVTRLEIDKAEQRFAEDDASTALAYLARIVRREPDNRVAAERILWALSYRNFCLPVLAFKHSGPVVAACYSPDGNMVLTASQDGTARLWDSRTGLAVTGPLKHDGPVVAIRFSPDGTKVATGGADNTARVWDACSGEPLTPPLPHGGSVTRLDFSPDGKWLATGSEDGNARVWATISGLLLTGPLAHSNAVRSVCISPDSERLLTASDQHVFVWETRTGLPVGTAFTDGNVVNQASFIKRGTGILVATANGRAIIWDFSSNTVVSSLGANENCLSVDLSPEGERVALAGIASYAQVWEIQTGKALTPHLKHTGPVSRIRFSPDGRRVLTGSGDSTVRIWDAETGQALTEPLRHEGSIRTAEFSPDGQRVLTVASDGQALIWEVRTGQPLAVELPHPAGIRYARFTPDGKSVLTVGLDVVGRTWDPGFGASRTNTARLSAHWLTSLEFSPDSRRIITASWDQAMICDAATGRQLCPPLQHPGTVPGKRSVVCAKFSPDGALAVTASTEGTVRIWNPTNGALLLTLVHGGPVNTVAFSPDGKQLVTACDDGKARVWSSNGILVRTFHHTSAVKDASFSPNGKLIVTASRDKTARLWHAQTGAPIGAPFNHKSEVRAAAFAPDSEKLFTVCDRVAFVWDLHKAGSTEPRTLFQGSVLQTYAFSPDGLRFVTGSRDQTVRVWDTDSGQPLSEVIRHDAGVNHAEFSPDGDWLATAPGNPEATDQRARILEIPRAVLPVPAWLLDLAEAVAGQRLDERNNEVSVAPEIVLKLRERIVAEPAQSPYARWGKWFFADTGSRTISPSSRITTAEYLQHRISENNLPSLEKALILSPTNSLAVRRFVHRGLEAGKLTNPSALAWADLQIRRSANGEAPSPELLATRSALLTAQAEYHRLASRDPTPPDQGHHAIREAMKTIRESVGILLGCNEEKGNYMKNAVRSPTGRALITALVGLSHWSKATAAELPVPDEYPTIQSAVYAAKDGDTIRIAPGDYYEQVLITNKTGLILRGEPGTVIHATPGMGKNLQPWAALPAVLGIVQSRGVALVGLTIDGNRLGGAYIGDGLQGVFYLSSSGSVQDCTIRGFRGDSQDTPSGARALVVWNPKSAGANGIEVNIISNRFEDNHQSITLGGDEWTNPTLLRTTVTIEGNTITGYGPAASAAAGVTIYTGVAGIVRGNTFSGHQYTGTGNSSAGIVGLDGLAASRIPQQWIPLRPIRIEGNTFRNNDDHVLLLNAPNSAVVNNIFEDSGPSDPWFGALGISGANIRVENNDFANLPTGIHLFGNDHILPGWPLTRPASNPRLIANWFSNVSSRVQIQPGATGLQEEGTVTNRFAPFFKSAKKVQRAGTSDCLSVTVRSWHDVPIILEASPDLRDWTPWLTNAPPLPVTEISTESLQPNTPRQYFRVLRDGTVPNGYPPRGGGSGTTDVVRQK